MTKTGSERVRFVVCVRSEGSDDLELRRVYQVLVDREGTRGGYLRVVDESGDDYLYPSDYFAPVKLPAAAEREFASSPLPPIRASATAHARSPGTEARSTRR